VVWTVPSPSPLKRSGGPHPVSTPSRISFLGLGSALPVKGSPTLRAFTHGLSAEVSSGRTARVRRVASYTKGQWVRTNFREKQVHLQFHRRSIAM
jgi:hypothetical protein